jgi:hypothetical protein
MTATDKPRTIRKGDGDFPSTPAPFKTSDAILAFCLYNLGVPEWRPPVNVYTEPILQRLGYRGLTLIEAAKSAWNHQERGKVEYWFEKTSEIEHYLNWYSDQEAEIKAERQRQRHRCTDSRDHGTGNAPARRPTRDSRFADG